MEIHNRIRYFREQKGITVNKLANLAGISQGHMREIELGIKNPSVETLSYICDALGISLKDFFDDDAFKRIQDDELYHEIYKLSELQRKALLRFLRNFRE